MIEPLQARVSIALEHADSEALAARDWYADARREARNMARETGHTLATALGVIAALSPREPWERNLELARAVLAGEPVRTMRAELRAAERIVAGERPLDVLQGPKVRRFYRNLTGDLEPVTVDVHAARAAGYSFTGSARIRPDDYPALERAYRNAAELHGLAPAEAQSVVWTMARTPQMSLFTEEV